jgi:cyanate lyase
MSAIDFRTSVTKKNEAGVDRVVITLDGKVCLRHVSTDISVPEILVD